jgi:hypothetical protein
MIGLISLSLYLFYDYVGMKKEIIRLRDQVKSANSTITIIDNVAAADADILTIEREFTDAIDKEPKANDASTAPVLLNAIKRLHSP